ncbi:MAG TPA: hypothetical protein VNA20_00645 [Frankiaceae bacterium]|nr:hypothetical protein [Frankiaceae bacterium]
MRITPYVLAATLVTAGLAADAGAATKKKPKPITRTYTATAPAPDFTNVNGGVCMRNVPQSWHTHTFKAPAAGKLNVVVSEFLGDWDVIVLDAKGTQIAMGDKLEQATPTDPKTEEASAKIRKAGSYQIIACNWAGGSTAKVKYTFTYV